MRLEPIQANRVVKVLSGMFRLAEIWEMIPPGRDLCRSVRPYREEPRERFLSSNEYRRLGDVGLVLFCAVQNHLSCIA